MLGALEPWSFKTLQNLVWISSVSSLYPDGGARERVKGRNGWNSDYSEPWSTCILNLVQQDLTITGLLYKILLCPDSWPLSGLGQHLVCGAQHISFSGNNPKKREKKAKLVVTIRVSFFFSSLNSSDLSLFNTVHCFTIKNNGYRGVLAIKLMNHEHVMCIPHN